MCGIGDILRQPLCGSISKLMMLLKVYNKSR